MCFLCWNVLDSNCSLEYLFRFHPASESLGVLPSHEIYLNTFECCAENVFIAESFITVIPELS